MRKKLILALLIAWVLAAAAMIFLFSSQTGAESGEASRGLMEKILSFLRLSAQNEERLHHLIRKAAHMTEYAMLGMSVFVLLFYLADIGYRKDDSCLRAATYAWIFATIFAVTDEIHQAFVPGRGPAVQDVLIDAVGAAIGIAAVWLVRRRWKAACRR